ncbi:MAG: hypothetical protein ACR2KB_12675 [Chitinophagaceae bacterium]|jgi:hypothetical protein|nr:hypothetical protein [Flavisolibacter sp.]
MTLHHFKNLDSSSKLSYLEHYGVFLDLSRYYKNVEVVLYSLKNFYVEVFVTPYQEILNIKCFKSTQKLDIYLPQVDITEIENLLLIP